jgi:type III pantothenate kinase
MIILIDSGNSRIKLGWLDLQDVPHQRETAATAFDKGELAALDDWIAALPLRPRLALGVNVAGEPQAKALSTLFQQHRCKVHWIRAQAETLGLINCYKKPEQLGADRWISLLGILGHLPAQHPPFMLASFGTATTVDTVGPDNVFAGGLILPGPTMMRRSLAAGTATLPLAKGLPVAYPTDTLAAIASGIAAAQAGALSRQWLAGWRLYGEAPTLYVTGGDWFDIAVESQRLLTEIGTAIGLEAMPFYLDNPVLDGLALLAANYQRPPS